MVASSASHRPWEMWDASRSNYSERRCGSRLVVSTGETALLLPLSCIAVLHGHYLQPSAVEL